MWAKFVKGLMNCKIACKRIVSNLLYSLSINTMSKWCKQFNHAAVDKVYLTILVINCNKFHFMLSGLFCVSSISPRRNIHKRRFNVQRVPVHKSKNARLCENHSNEQPSSVFRHIVWNSLWIVPWNPLCIVPLRKHTTDYVQRK